MLAPQVRTIVEKLKSNYTYEQIGQILEVDAEKVESCIKESEKFEEKGARLKVRPLPEMQNKREVGRPKVLENRQLVEKLLNDHPQFTSIDVQRELLDRYGIEVSRRTLQRRISEIRAKQFQLKNGGLSVETRKRRLEWARAHEKWTLRDWRNIFNMDDYKVVDGDMPKQIYMDTLVGPECTECNDLNLMEQLMAIIEPKLKAHAPKTIYEFKSKLYEIWHSDPDLVTKSEQLYEMMVWRVTTVIQTGGGETDFC